MDFTVDTLLEDLQTTETSEAIFIQSKLPRREFRRILRAIRTTPTSDDALRGLLKILGTAREGDVGDTLHKIAAVLVRKHNMTIPQANAAIQKAVRYVITRLRDYDPSWAMSGDQEEPTDRRDRGRADVYDDEFEPFSQGDFR